METVHGVARFAQELQTLLSNAAGVPVYEGDAPRDSADALAATPPYVVYSLAPFAPDDEGGEWRCDLTVDVWTMGSFSACFGIAMRIDDALNATAYEFESGRICADRNGVCFQRMERDQYDERIRRIQSQYLIRFNEDFY